MQLHWPWSCCTSISTFADHCLLQKITGMATTPTERSNMAKTHNAGAAALVMHRGLENCKSSLSVGLLFSVRSQLVSTDPNMTIFGLKGNRSSMP